MTGVRRRYMFATLGPGSVLLADRAYDSDALRARLAKQGAWGNIRQGYRMNSWPVFATCINV